MPSRYEGLVYESLSRKLMVVNEAAKRAGVTNKIVFEQCFTAHLRWNMKVPPPLRKDVYRFFYNEICTLGFDSPKFLSYKRTPRTWKEVGLNPANLYTTVYGGHNARIPSYK